jgi:hypothetical protein
MAQPLRRCSFGKWPPPRCKVNERKDKFTAECTESTEEDKKTERFFRAAQRERARGFCSFLSVPVLLNNPHHTDVVLLRIAIHITLTLCRSGPNFPDQTLTNSLQALYAL